MDIWQIILVTAVKIFIIVNVLLLTVSYLVLFERKISAWAQNRYGPNRVGVWGALQPFADVFKLLLKEDIVPEKANKFLHSLAPFIALFVAFSTYAVIPFGPEVTIFG
ncbi:MAG: NADH-quinone oxidoreductase subunit H, partial [Ignavibacteria bacterium]